MTNLVGHINGIMLSGLYQGFDCSSSVYSFRPSDDWRCKSFA